MIKAVFFDLGGVVLDSPIHTISKIERDFGLPRHSLNKALGLSPLFHQLERGEISVEEFHGAFKHYLLNQALPQHAKTLESFDVAKFMTYDIGSQMQIRPHFAKAIKKLRQSGRYQVIAVTNNWKLKLSDRNGAGFGSENTSLVELFDGIVESCVVGNRKPSAEIFQKALKLANIKDSESSTVVFLDDIRNNIIGAQRLGLQIIHVKEDGTEALKQLSKIVGMNLLEVESNKSNL